MEYCEAYPVRKPIPKHQITTETPCRSEAFRNCPLFMEFLSKLHARAGESAELTGKSSPKEVS